MLLKRFRVEGHSMEPKIKAGSNVLVFKTRRIKVGDIVALKYSGVVIIKRVSEVRVEGTFKVEGDNRADSSPVPPITAKEIIGKVIFKY